MFAAYNFIEEKWMVSTRADSVAEVHRKFEEQTGLRFHEQVHKWQVRIIYKEDEELIKQITEQDVREVKDVP